MPKAQLAPPATPRPRERTDRRAFSCPIPLLAALLLFTSGKSWSAPAGTEFGRIGEFLIATASPDCVELLGYDVSPRGDAVLYFGRLRDDANRVGIWLNARRIVPACDSVQEYGFTAAGKPYVCYSLDGRQYAFFDGAISREFDAIVLDSLTGSRFVLSPSGDRIAFAARDGVWMTAVQGLKPGARYTTVARLVFGPGRDFYYLARKGNAWLLVGNGKESKPHDLISDLALLPKSGKPLLTARDREQELLIVDGHESRRWEQITEVTFTPRDSVPAYVASDSGCWFVVEDTTIRVREPGVLLHSLRYKSDTREPVYVLLDAGLRSTLKTDGRPASAAFDNIEHVTVSPDGRSVLYQTFDSSGTRVWVNRRLLGVPTGIAGPVIFSPAPGRYAFVTRSDSGVRVVTDSGTSRLHDVVDELRFSPDGRSLAYVARNAGKSFVIENDREGPGYDAVGYLQFAPTTGWLAYLAVSGSKTSEIVAGVSGDSWDDIGPARFSPDGARIAYPARQGSSFLWVCTQVP